MPAKRGWREQKKAKKTTTHLPPTFHRRLTSVTVYYFYYFAILSGQPKSRPETRIGLRLGAREWQ